MHLEKKCIKEVYHHFGDKRGSLKQNNHLKCLDLAVRAPKINFCKVLLKVHRLDRYSEGQLLSRPKLLALLEAINLAYVKSVENPSLLLHC